jgi:adenylate cyclase
MDGRPQIFTVSKDIASIGRANDNDIVLNDFSVSRRHAFIKRENEEWVIVDNQSTNGVPGQRQAGAARRRPRRGPRPDRHVPAPFQGAGRGAAGARPADPMIDSTSTRIRPIAEFNEDYGLDPAIPPPDSTADRKRAAPDAAYRNRVFEILVQVAKALISADDLETVLDKVMDLIFEFLPVDRAFLLLQEEASCSCATRATGRPHRHTSDGTTP